MAASWYRLGMGQLDAANAARQRLAQEKLAAKLREVDPVGWICVPPDHPKYAQIRQLFALGNVQ